eukprot:TRINITY_DN821_c0_g1_i8.p1 TRINITY_DN821_c0_g1~~TRINITY_DN821_c0_g1_i8.p1  ORF type:complete len:115 (-),score=14.35 TRINITY_DN821_c0_g1_i8:172-489(-)
MSELMVKFMFITVDSLSISYRSSIGRSLSKPIPLSIVISGMSILETSIMAVFMAEAMVKFLLISVDSSCFRSCLTDNQTQSQKRNQRIHDVSCLTTRRTPPCTLR